MKTEPHRRITMKIKIMMILALLVFALSPLTSASADMWDETPNPSDDLTNPSFVPEPFRFVYKRPAVDMWAETPNVSAESEDYDLVLENEVRIVKGLAHPEFYAETPDLSIIQLADEPKGEREILIGPK
jgi:hypothetical protein